MSFYAIRLSQQ